MTSQGERNSMKLSPSPPPPCRKTETSSKWSPPLSL